MKIGIIGYGVVGKAASNTFEKAYEVIKYDKFQDLDSFEDLIQCDFVFIMVPTPFDYNHNKVDDTAVRESLRALDDLNYSGIIIIKSTLAPGICDSYMSKYKLEIVFNPEFLRESTTPFEDFKNQKIVVIGTNSKNNFNLIKNMYSQVLSTDANYYSVLSKEAEMIKCAQNTMLASRVALANMINDACESNGIDYDLVRKIAFDKFSIIGPDMVLVPGPDGKKGFGGKCLPKDILAFSTIYNSKLLSEIIDYNCTLRDDLDNFIKNYN